MKEKLKSSRVWALLVAMLAMVLSTVTAQAVPVDVDPADALAQVAATAADLLPYAIAVAVAGIVFRLVRKWIR